MGRLLPGLLVFVLVSACATPPADAPPAGAGAASGTPPVSDALTPAPAPEVAYDLDTCLPTSLQGLDATFHETARVTEGGETTVLVEWIETNASRSAIAGDFHPVLFRLDGGACESLLPEQTDAFDLSDHVSESALADLYRQNTEWKASRVGGMEEYVAFLLPDGADTLAECEDDGDLGACVDPPRAEALRALGVEVRTP